MPLISLAMIVKNEEAHLAHCLESVKALVDEMVIVDTGSTDRTIEIAREYSAKIYNFEWCDDFSAARNESLKHCSGNWVLILDADEAIDPLDYEKIKNACLNPTADAYSLIHRHYRTTANVSTMGYIKVPNLSGYTEGKEISFYSDNETLRLVSTFDGLAFSGRIHEQISSSLLSHNKYFEALDAVIHHYGKLFANRQEHKAQYYLELAIQEAENDPSNSWTQFNLLQQALAAGRWELAHNAAQACLENSAKVEPFVLYGNGVALKELGRHEEAIRYFDMLLDINPKHALALCEKGSSLVATGNISAGRLLVIQAMEVEPGYAPAYQYLSQLDFSMGKIDSARTIAMKALEIAPSEQDLYSLLLNIELANNNHQQAAKVAMAGVQNCPNGGNGLWHRLASVYLMKEGKLEEGRSILNRGLKAFPDDPELERLKGMI
ncbi:MAG: glycosyltransferase [Holophagaceae bacterium]|nr:glycosyltransferase [Holophagaceae bacterium]